MPGRRHGDFVELLKPLQSKAQAATAEVIDELSGKGHRMVVAHDPEQAQVLTQRRRDRIAALQARAPSSFRRRPRRERERILLVRTCLGFARRASRAQPASDQPVHALCALPGELESSTTRPVSSP